MSGRLFLFSFALVMLLAALLMGVILLFGRFSAVERRTTETLSVHLSVLEHDLVNHVDSVAARAIKLSQDLTQDLEDWLDKEKLTFNNLSGNPEILATLEDFLYDTLYNALQLTDCSGAYFMLDATANLNLPGAEHSKAGIYIKLVNVNVTRSVRPKLALYRGYTTAHSQRHELHNMWALEFNTNFFPIYNVLVENANHDLNSCFLLTEGRRLPGTWEEVMLLGVPLIANNGTVYGICGFEISQTYFKLFHAHSGAIPHISGLLAPASNDKLHAYSGFASGDRTGYYTKPCGELLVNQRKGLSIYSSNDSAFVGMDRPINLSPLEQERHLAVFIPKSDYDGEKATSFRENAVIGILLMLSAIFGSVFMSRMYVKPILRGIRQARSDELSGFSVNIQEIDDLLEFLSSQDQQRETELRTMQEQLAALGSLKEEKKYPLPCREDYEEFISNLGTLTNAEREVFNLYMQGHRAKDMPGLLFRSINTIKTHNKRIYVKLGVSSRNELMGYMQMMKLEGHCEQSDSPEQLS